MYKIDKKVIDHRLLLECHNKVSSNLQNKIIIMNDSNTFLYTIKFWQIQAICQK